MAPGGESVDIFEKHPTMKTGKWYKLSDEMDVWIPDKIFDFMLIWSPDNGLSMESVQFFDNTSVSEENEIEWTHFQFIKLPVKV